jgi:hypothetical protein
MDFYFTITLIFVFISELLPFVSNARVNGILHLFLKILRGFLRNASPCEQEIIANAETLSKEIESEIAKRKTTTSTPQ